MPLIVAITTTSATNTSVFFVPMTLLITSMFGRLSAGPASSSARAGPLPIPLPIRPCNMGTSVRVAKYISAPANEAKKFALREFGFMARVVLETWGVARTEDIGEIVFNMVNHGLLGKTPTDSRADFESGYDFLKGLDDSFELELPDRDGS